MNTQCRKATKVIALLLVISMMQVYVMATTVKPLGSTNEAASKSAPGALLFGQLEMDQDKSILVNSNPAVSGTTIFSGAQLVTPEAVGAAVQMESLGRLDIAPQTSLTLTFDQKSVNVVVTKGNAYLVTKEGIKGTVTLPDGKTKASDAALPDAAPQAEASSGLFGLSTGATFALGAAIIGGAIILAVELPCRKPKGVTPGAPNANDCNRGL
jgi:hypothetical protein